MKNLRASLINNKIIVLPEQFQKSNTLSSQIVQFTHLQELVHEQENLLFKLAPKLKRDVITSTNFNKMKVNKATSMLNRDVSSALNILAEEQTRDDYKTTALFIEIVSKWFTLITSRTPVVALGKKAENENSETMFNQNIQFLESVIDLFCDMEIGKNKQFKPVQAGIMLTTQSLIKLTMYLINNRGYAYVLGGRFTQDCVENLFSNVRKRFPIPNTLQFKQSLKILSVSQYLQALENTSYEQDDGVLLSHFSLKRKRRCQTDVSQVFEEEPVIPLEAENRVIHLNNLEMNSLYSVSGYILSRICNTNTICTKCLDSAGSKTFNPTIKFSTLVQLRCYKKNALFFVNNETFNYFHEMEVIFRQYIPYLKHVKYDLLTFFLHKMAHLYCNNLINCHNISNIIMKRFIRFRLKIECEKGRLKTPVFSSLTMARHSIVK